MGPSGGGELTEDGALHQTYVTAVAQSRTRRFEAIGVFRARKVRGTTMLSIGLVTEHPSQVRFGTSRVRTHLAQNQLGGGGLGTV